MALTRTRSPKILKDLFCGCGKAADVCWTTPLPPRGPKKLSKSDKKEQEEETRDPQPYGWSCDVHEPPLD